MSCVLRISHPPPPTIRMAERVEFPEKNRRFWVCRPPFGGRGQPCNDWSACQTPLAITEGRWLILVPKLWFGFNIFMSERQFFSSSWLPLPRRYAKRRYSGQEQHTGRGTHPKGFGSRTKGHARCRPRFKSSG